MAISKPVQILRWFAVLPGAFLCALVVEFPIHWVVMLIQLFGGSNDDSVISVDGKIPLAAIPPEMLERFGYAFFTPVVIIVFGTKIAPSFKMQTGIALAILWGIFFGAGMTFLISQGHYSGSSWLRFAITCVLGIAGVSVGLVEAHKAQKQKNIEIDQETVDHSIPDAIEEQLKTFQQPWSPETVRNGELRSAHLAGVNLRGANLFMADMAGADLSGADLGEAFLVGADLTAAKFNNAYLHRASLTGAFMTYTDLSGANLTLCDMASVDLRGAKLIGALGLVQSQIDSALTDDSTIVDAHLSVG